MMVIGTLTYSEFPQAIRTLLLQWGLEEDSEQRRIFMEAAQGLAETLLMNVAPLEWAWAHFPVLEDEVVSISFAADAMEALAQLGAIGGGGHYLGRAGHVAHVLKTRQLPEGCWPDRCSARTGEALDGSQCVLTPLMLFSRLDQLQETTEYRGAILLARDWLLEQCGQGSTGF